MLKGNDRMIGSLPWVPEVTKLLFFFRKERLKGERRGEK